jgi:8-oxo-dGTP diphosphatase
MTYLEHLKNELRSFLRNPISLIFITILMLYQHGPSQLLTLTFWLQWIGVFAIIFPLGQYLNYKYLQKNKDPFKERLSAAIRADDDVMNILKTKKVIAALIMRDSKILIAQRGKKDANYGKWEFPGGKLEENETEQECLARELFEELSIHAQIGDYFCSSFFEHKDTAYEMRTYFVPFFTGEIELREHQEVRWVNIEELSEYDMPDPDKPIVKKLLNLNSSIPTISKL